MNTLPFSKANVQIDLLRTFSILAVGAGLLFAAMGFLEFYNVAIAGQASIYPFGTINDNPWYYKNAEIFAMYNGVTSLLFLSAAAVTIWGIAKRKRFFLAVGSSLLVVLVFLVLVSGQAQ